MFKEAKPYLFTKNHFMFQIPKSFDPMTVEKIKRSAILAVGGFVLAALTTILADKSFLEYLAAHPLVSMFVGSFAPFIINTIKQWLAGQPMGNGDSSIRLPPDA